jgi:RNA polymerase sigma-70 factor, ECF subfamily
MPRSAAPDPTVKPEAARSTDKPRSQTGAAVVRLVVPQRGRSDGSQAGKLPAPTDEALVRAVQAGARWAAAALLERYSPMVERLLRRVLGHDPEIEDLVQDALTTVLTSIGQVRDGAAVKGWIAQIAIHTAHRAIRKRRLHRWLLFWYPRPSEEVSSPVGPRDALRRLYVALDELPPDERIPFTLRFMDEMPLEDVAAACGVSLATIKRRLARAEKKFLAMAKRDTALSACVEEGDRWTME